MRRFRCRGSFLIKILTSCNATVGYNIDNFRKCTTPDWYEKPLKATPYLRPKKAETYPSSDAVAKNLAEVIFLNRPSRTKRREVTGKTDWGGMATITRERLEKRSRSPARSRASPVCQQNITFSVIHSQVTQMSEITLSAGCNIPIISFEAIVENTSLSLLNSVSNFRSCFRNLHGMRLTSGLHTGGP